MPDEDVVFSTTGVGGIAWLWDFGHGTTSDEQNPTHVFEQLGEYTVSLTATSLHGCTSISSADIGIITGIEKSLADNLEVYPNPVNGDIVVIKLSTPMNYVDISLYDSQGSQLKIFARSKSIK